MKYAGLAFLVLVALVPSAHAAIINGSFESGDFTGWDVAIPYGESEFYGTRPAGSAVVSDTISYGHASTDGLFNAALGTGDEYFVDNQTWLITVSQNVYLTAGDILSGDAFFYNGDYEPQDSGWVKIFDAAGDEMATPWQEYSGGLDPGDPNTADYLTASAWNHWQWLNGADGLYKLVLGVTTRGDNAFDSYAHFDNIGVRSVPEPTVFSLMAFVVLAVAAVSCLKKYLA